MHDDDEEIEEFMTKRQDWEIKANVTFSKNGIIQFIEDKIAKEDPANDELWKRKLKTPNMQYYIKKGGSDLNKD